MPFLQVSVEVGSRDPEPYEQCLLALGALSVTLEDAADDPVLEPLPGAMPLWPTVRIKSLFLGPKVPVFGSRVVFGSAHAFAVRWATALHAVSADAPDPQDQGKRAPTARTEDSCEPNTGTFPWLQLRFEHVDDRPWEREWLRDFKPMQFGTRLWICPGGQPPGAADAIVVELDPGLAFGTGTHPTTRLCLEWLDAHPPAGLSVIDFGCGSGILAIAALKLGAAQALGVDLDPQALLATGQNAERNAVTVTLLPAAEATTLKADLVLANILAGPLIELAPRFAAILPPGGRLVLAGLLADQAAAVTAAHQPWFHIAPFATCDGWTLLTGRRRAP